jgi:hypothetical protein
LPTHKPSRLSLLNSGKLNFGLEFISSSNSKAQHIYITSDKTPKYLDYYIVKTKDSSGEREALGQRLDKNNSDYSKCKKIILTTDSNLIKDGVQAIDDEFLEWFIEGAKWQLDQNNTSNVTRIEVIQHSEPYNGRAYTNYNAKNVELQYQDKGKTLKIFLK